jgi:hypothetical protein
MGEVLTRNTTCEVTEVSDLLVKYSDGGKPPPTQHTPNVYGDHSMPTLQVREVKIVITMR